MNPNQILINIVVSANPQQGLSSYQSLMNNIRAVTEQTAMQCAAIFQKHFGSNFFGQLSQQAGASLRNGMVAGAGSVSTSSPRYSPVAFSGPASPYTSHADPAMQSALRDIQRMQQQRMKWESDLTNFTIKENEKRYRSTVSTLQRTMVDVKSAISNTDQAIKGSDVFSGTFWGTLSANITSKFLSVISEIPGKIRETLDEAIHIASERQNAMKGLESIAIFKGVDSTEAQKAVMNFRLVKAGIVDVGEATTSLKNLLATGFSLPESIKLFEGFSDAASFGKQQALNYGEAVRSATEGIKNQNSILVDNAGVTKNLSVILTEAGKSEKDLQKVSTDASVRQALYNGLLKEMRGQMGDADKLTKTYAGSTAGLDMAFKNLEATVGDYIINNPKMIEANRINAEKLQELTKQTQNADSATAKFIDNAVEKYAQLKVGIAGTVGSILATFGYMATALGTALGAILTVVSGMVEGTIGGIQYTFDKGKSEMIDFINWTIDQVNAHPWLAASLGGPAGASMIGAQHLPNPAVGSSGDYTPITNELARATSNLGKATVDLFNTAAKLQNEANAAMARISAVRTGPSYSLNDQPDDYRDYKAGRLPFARDTTPDSPIEKAQKAKKAPFQLSPEGQALVNTANRLGIDPLDLASIIAFESAGTFSPSKNNGQGHFGLIQFGASEARSYGANPNQSFAQQMGAVERYFTDRFKQAGMTPAGASLLQLYTSVIAGSPTASPYAKDANGTNAMSVLSRIQGESRQAALKRFFGGSTGNINRTDASRFDVGKYSDELTEADRMAMLNRAFEAWQTMGLIPNGEMLNRFKQMLTERAKTGASVIGLAPGLQPDEAAIKGYFAQTAAARLTRQGAVTAPTSQIAGLGALTPHLTVDQEYVKGLRESMNLSQRVTDYVLRERNINAEISAIQDDIIQKRKEEFLQNRIDYELAVKRNTAEEARLEFAKSQTDQVNHLKDIQKELSLLNAQNGDPQYVSNRNLLAVQSERLDIAKQLTDIETERATGPANQSLREYVAIQQTLLDIDRADLDARTQLAQISVQMADKTVYHQDQANARVASHINQIRGLTEIYSDAKIQIVDGLFGGIDHMFDKLTNRFPILSRMLSDFLSGLTKLFLSPFLNRILTGQSGSQNSGGGGGGGFGGVLQSIFGAGLGGGSMGPGGTATFNPNGGGFGSSPGGSGIGNFAALGGAVLSPSQMMGGHFFGSAGGAINGIASGVGSGSSDMLSQMVNHDQLSSLLEHATGAEHAATGGVTNAGIGSAISGGLSGFGASLAPMLPFLGLGIGSGLYKNSKTASVMGGIGGTLAGISALGLLAPGTLAGGIAGLGIGGATALSLASAATVIGLVAAPALLLAGYFINRSAKRRQQEQQRTQILTDSKMQLQSILDNLKGGKMDSATALTSAAAIRQNYLNQVGQLSDSKTRNIAITTVRELDYMISNIRTEGARADAAASLEGSIVPTFSSGGYVGASGGMYGGVQFTGFGGSSYADHIPAMLTREEVVLNHQNIMNLGGYDAMRRAGVRGINMTPRLPDTSSRAFQGMGAGSGTSAATYNIFAGNEKMANAIFEQVKSKGVARKMRLAVYSGNDDGFADTLESRLAGEF